MVLLLSLLTGVLFLVLAFCAATVITSLTEGGTLWHPGWRLHNPKVLLLVADLDSHPESYTLSQFRLQSGLVTIWTGSGWPFYADEAHAGSTLKVGPFTVADRCLFRRALKEFGGTGLAQFETALLSENKKKGYNE